HGPERHYFFLGISIDFRKAPEALSRYPGFPGGVLQRIGPDKCRKVIKGNISPAVGIPRAFCIYLTRIFGAQSITDIVLPPGKTGVFIDKIMVDLAALDNVVGNVIENNKIGMWLENYRDIRQ